MHWITHYIWLIPALPMAAAGAIAFMGRTRRAPAMYAAIGAMGLAFILSCIALFTTLGGGHEGPFREVCNFTWFELGRSSVQLGWVLDPLSAVMAVMVTFVGGLIFIYSVGYMAHDENFTRFFGFLALFAGAMLGLVLSNSLLLLFICWELVGLASYLLIGFWYHKPSAAAAAKKAFITTRIGDMGFLLGMVWLYAETGTLLFYEQGRGCLEPTALNTLVQHTTVEGIVVATAIGLLLFCGAMGKSGQVPLHVWLPDAMEGPTPVSALIHAATMVAAGVFLMARVFPLLDADVLGVAGYSPALVVVAWVGAITAVFAALIAVAQSDIKRILAYSTVSQLGYMMMALGVGGWVAAMFHLITHAFFKALLFMGAGSVIHGCHEEQDIRRMGGLRDKMPTTFLTYAIGMMALSGVPFFFSGFWSKDEILHGAFEWGISKGPFILGVFGAFLTAFYMTRQVCYVFWGSYRGESAHAEKAMDGKAKNKHSARGRIEVHESPSVMTVPLQILAIGAVVLGFFGTPAWPWFHGYLTGHHTTFDMGRLFTGPVLLVMGMSIVVVGAGILTGWRLYGVKPLKKASDLDYLERRLPETYAVLRDKFRIDEIYEATVLDFVRNAARFCRWIDDFLSKGAVLAISNVTLALSWLNRMFDEFVINGGFDTGCRGVKKAGDSLSLIQDGRVQNYLRVVGIVLVVLVIALAWGGAK